MRFVVSGLCFAALILNLDCVSSAPHYSAAGPGDRIDRAPRDKALIIFFCSSSFCFQPTLYLDESYIGTLGLDSHISFLVEPGEYRFMVLGENIDLLDTNVAAGETYHVLVRAWASWPSPPGYKGRYGFEPFNASDWRIGDWYSRSTQVTPTPYGAEQAAQLLEENHARIEKFKASWEAKDDRVRLHTPTMH